jgi:hypothetical protein
MTRAGALVMFNAPGVVSDVPAGQVDDTTKVLRIDGLLPAAPAHPLRRSMQAH